MIKNIKIIGIKREISYKHDKNKRISEKYSLIKITDLKY